MSNLKFAVVIPFRPKTESSNWEQESRLLDQTVQSVLAQTYQHIKVFVVCTDVPFYQVADERVCYEHLPFPYQPFAAIPIHQELLQKFKSEKMVVRRWDKARKITWGCKLAKEEGFDYIMSLDADDLLSKHFFARLAAASEEGKCPGWYMHSGYLYKRGTKYLMLVPKLMRFLNGSTHVLRSDLIRIPDFDSVSWYDYSLFTDHGWIKERFKKYLQIDLQRIDEPMLVYVVHESNISKVHEKEYARTLKNFVKRILRGRLLTAARKAEFHIQYAILISFSLLVSWC